MVSEASALNFSALRTSVMASSDKAAPVQIEHKSTLGRSDGLCQSLKE